ncbi:hypothetical protein NQ317_007534 [Molorchus minor]|uniref:Zonadhesin n=1 Tax=Molorchus minor TaxID=1323400 RepID=A0ABQ9K4M2_9CUCU|nr:hypothetical protein NQ317_007534 [Molorchus minor]
MMGILVYRKSTMKTNRSLYESETEGEIMRKRHRKWIFLGFLMSLQRLVLSEHVKNSSTLADSNGDPNQRSIILPRLDYDQWKPLGRGDPLKNDPTYDYVPPMLDRVQYWVDPESRKPDPPAPEENQKTEILLLGITSKKPAVASPQADSRRDAYEPYAKYLPGTSSYNSHQRIARPSFIPSFATSFFPSFFSSNKNKYTDRTTFSKGNEQRVPYTMLMPPPPEDNGPLSSLPETSSPLVAQKASTPFVFTTAAPTTTPLTSSSSAVTVQAANLVYQSSSLSDATEFSPKRGPPTSSIIWEPSSTTTNSIPNYREELVYNTNLSPPDPFTNIEFASTNYSNKPLVVAATNQNINFVTPPPLVDSPKREVMFKGQVTDDDLDILNRYVKIGKPEAEVHSTGLEMPNIDDIVQRPMSNIVVFPHLRKPPVSTPEIPPLTMQVLEEMQTMHPPPVTKNPIFTMSTNPVVSILDKEKSRPIVFEDLTADVETTNYVGSSSSLANSFVTVPPTTTEKVPKMTTSTEAMKTSTTETSLTTDPLFKHYKQPMEALRGPLYMIIQGHSKVKTYGPTKQIHGILVQETNEISDDKYDKEFEVKHLHSVRKEANIDDRQRKGRSGNLQTLKHVVQTGLGAIDFSNIDEIKRRGDDDFQETEVQVGYEVAEGNDVTTEIYHRGIVEEARKLDV